MRNEFCFLLSLSRWFGILLFVYEFGVSVCDGASIVNKNIYDFPIGLFIYFAFCLCRNVIGFYFILCLLLCGYLFYFIGHFPYSADGHSRTCGVSFSGLFRSVPVSR